MRTVPHDPNAVEVILGGPRAELLLTCEHASNRLPERWRWPREDERLVDDHWAFDLGAADLTRELAAAARADAVLSRFTRLLADPNRPESSDTLFRTTADDAPVVLNQGVDAEDRHHRLSSFYRPYHSAVDSLVASSTASILFSVHTFTPVYEGERRELEVGVLFDDEESLAGQLIDGLRGAGLSVAGNEPYSGREGLIYAVDMHAKAHGRRALEIEVRQDLATSPSFRAKLVALLVDGLCR